ncbi:hypothetical protein ACLI1A_04740 [Flavobacterium sp. RHBU_3]|uniref:hypothetical protein n=1 Tax=Flavobacterium sp. RHBU_3 TaxID=3391184 RepID=UPI003984BFE8
MKKSKYAKFILILLIAFMVSVLFRITGNSFNVYENAVVGAIFEILWLPMLVITFGSPIAILVLFILYIRQKSSV